METVDNADIAVCIEGCIFRDGVTCDEDFFELFTIYMVENDIMPPTNAEEAIALYHELRALTSQDIVD